MKKFKALYKAMYDDLKDAEMMIDYACEVREHEEDKALADELAKYAKFRLEHFMQFHKLFVGEAMKHKEVNEKTVDHCMWHEAHEQMQEWHDKIEKKIAKYK
jgi:selenocysteine-specific translation elongation factor